MKIYLDNNLGVTKVEQEELTQDTYGYNILKVYIPNAVLTPYNTFTCYYGALLQNGRKVGWFAMEARTSTDADYEANYTLYKATLEQCVVSVEGKVYIGCQVLLGNSGNATLIKKNTAVVQFNVRKSVAINNDILVLDTDQTTTDVLESYKNLLENALLTYATKATTYTKTEVDGKLDLKADKSDTYTKTEVNVKDLNLAAQMASDKLELNNRINITNDILTATQAEVNSALALKADKSDTYTKTEIDTKAVKYDSFDGNIKDHINNLDEKGKAIGRGWVDLTRYDNYQLIEKYRLTGYKTDGTYTPDLSANNNCDTIIFDLPHAVLKYKIGANVFVNVGIIYKENEKAFLCNQSTNVEYYRQSNGYIYIDCEHFIRDGYTTIALSFDRYVYDIVNVFDDISDYISKSMKVTHSSSSFSDVLFDGSKIKTNRIDLSELENLNIRFGEYMNGYDTNVFIPTFRSLTTDNIGVLEFKIPDGYYWIKLPISNNAFAHTQVAVLYKPNDRAVNIQATETYPNRLFEVYNGYTYINFRNALGQGYTHISINIDLDSFYIDRCEKYIDKPQYLSLYLFGDFGVVGDSYTRGDAFTQNETNVVNPNKSWGSTIAHRNGMNYTNYGYGGANTRSYYTTEAYTRLMSDDPKPLYILDFGINDMVLGNDYIGSISDINLSDPTLNADTFYGNYGKLISQILNRNSNARIVLLSIATPLHTQLTIAFNTAIKNIANLFNIPFIDLYDDDYFYSRLYQSMQEGHPTYIGYNGMGLAIERLMVKCIEDNFTYFEFAGLDLTREGENCNIEIPESYKNYYVVTSDDITDFTPLGSNEFEITLSEELENVITDFKQGIYIDWATLFPDIPSSYNVCCYVPTKKVVLDGKIHYLLSCVDSLIDATLSFYKVDNQWKLSMIEASLIDRETLNYEVSQLTGAINEKSKVVANPTLSGDEATLEGAEIDGIKYKVGGGSKLYKHNIYIQENGSGHFIQTLGLTIYTTNNSPITFSTLPNYFPSNFNRGYSCTGYSSRDSVVTGVTNYYASFHNESGTLYAKPMFSNNIDILSNSARIIDTITEV